MKQNVRQIYLREVAWSPIFKQARDEKNLLLRIKKCRTREIIGNNISLSLIRRFMQQTQLLDVSSRIFDEIDDNLLQIYKQFIEVH